MFERLLIDSHVHVHGCYDEAQFLEAACRNLLKDQTGTPTLLLAEMAERDVFTRWRSGHAAWPVTATQEPASLILGGRLLVIAGRQLVTHERIEVIALACTEFIADGLSLDATIAAVRKAGAVPVLPWGVGKWLGKRGRLVARAAARNGLFLGDNAGRPLGWPQPALFQQHVVLAGTDPLQLRTEQEQVGRYGFVLEGRFDCTRPARAIVNALQQLTETPPTFGRRVSPFDFFRLQLGLRLAR